MAEAVDLHVHGHVVQALDQLGRDDLGRWPVGLQLALVQHHQPVGVLRRQVQVVQDGDGDPVVRAGLLVQVVHQHHLVAHVQRADRFVQHHHFGRAQQHLGKQRHLPLAAAERVDGPLGNVQQAHGFQRVQRRQHGVVVDPHAQTVQSAQHHHLQGGEIQVQPGVLRHVAEALAPDGQPLLALVVTVEADVAGAGMQLAEEGAHQAGLAAAVGADDGRDLAGVELHRVAAGHRVCAGMQVEVLDFKHDRASIPGSARRRRAHR